MSASIYLLSAVRTPIGKFGGSLAGLSAAELGEAAARAAIERAGIAAGHIDEVIMGNARPAGVGPNVARQIGHRAGLPVEIPAYSINKACGSSLRAIISGVQAIKAGDASLVLAGGSESMSNVPYLLTNARWGQRLGHDTVVDGMYADGFLCKLCNQVMGETAETLSEQYGITREEQDAYAAKSQQRCEQARKTGRFADEIIPIQAPQRKGAPLPISHDEHPRDGVSPESLAKLPAVFKQNGTVHAGNSSGIVDGASAVVIADDAFVRKHAPSVLARIVDYTIAGVDPAVMGLGPVPAMQKLLQRQKLRMHDIDLIELNEAFAAQVLACDRELHFDHDRLNVNGGAIALGHPIGATGARITTTLVHEMHKRKVNRGVATLCISGGQGIALLLERV